MQYTIGALARAAEVPTTTVRYYERTGLLPPEGRSGGNYRSYSVRSLERLRFIRAAQANGFTLDDVKRFYEERYVFESLQIRLAGDLPDGFAERVREDYRRVLPSGSAVERTLPAVPTGEGLEKLKAAREQSKA